MGNVCCWDKLWSTWRSPVIGWQITDFDQFLTIYSIFWPIKLTAILADHSPALLERTSWSARRLQWRKKDITFTFPFPKIVKVPRKALSRFFRKESLFSSKKNGQLPFFSGWAAAWQLEFGIDRKILVAKFLLIRCERSSLLGGSKISCMRLSGHLVGPGFTLWLGLSLPDRSSTDDQLQANAGADLAGWWRRTTKCGAVQWAAESKRPRWRGRGSRQRKIWGGGPLLRCKAALVLTNKYLLREVKMR